ncbi:MAG: phosphate ABC transporter permease subunit PstC [Candidatus Ornithospirochaeta sp.]|nr:phosphate ABC transporter permease subunit PstC [Candidatus Ornithospirochaeta sp.]
MKQRFARMLFMATALISVLSVMLICFFMFSNGIPAIFRIGFLEFLGGRTWKPSSGVFGILPMIVGSVFVTLLSVIIGVPIGILSAVYLAFFCPKKAYRLLKPAVELLAGIPSIVYGYFGLTVIVPVMQYLFGGSGKSMLTASVLLAMMILPTVITVSESSLRAVPSTVLDSALALGDTKERGVFMAMIPAAKSGILSSAVLGIGRSIGETMAVIMVAGNQPVMPTSLFRGLRTMTANIVLEMGYAADLHREALIATSVVLFVFVLVINSVFAALRKESER